MDIAILNARVSKTVTLAKVDGRSPLGRLISQVRSDLAQHVGGKPTAVQRMLIERAATLTGYLARLDGDALSPAGMSDHRRREYLAADGALRRTLREIGVAGVERRREPVKTPLEAMFDLPAGTARLADRPVNLPHLARAPDMISCALNAGIPLNSLDYLASRIM